MVAKHQNQQACLPGLLSYFDVLELIYLASMVTRGLTNGCVSLSVRSYSGTAKWQHLMQAVGHLLIIYLSPARSWHWTTATFDIMLAFKII